MGMPFLRAYYSIYDLDNMAIGLSGDALASENRYEIEVP